MYGANTIYMERLGSKRWWYLSKGRGKSYDNRVRKLSRCDSFCPAVGEWASAVVSSYSMVFYYSKTIVHISPIMWDFTAQYYTICIKLSTSNAC